jgi:serine/threonine protein kinase
LTEFHAGDVVGGYRLEARLGGGGFGAVWRARHTGTGRLVAIKLLSTEATDAEQAHIAADIELLAASAAGHSPHVVRVIDGGVDTVPYAVMEFVAGTSLAEELRQRQRLPQDEVIEIGLGVADALRALDEASIVHRDVKPSNVLIDRNGEVKLTDFGIAKIVGFDSRTVTGQLRLSIAYAAPEVWEGHAEHRSDLYALGIVLFQCLSGTLPFRGGYTELFYLHRNQAPDFAALPRELAPSLDALVRACLSKDPVDRPENAAACIQLLLKAREELPATVSAPAAPQEPDRFGPWLKLEPISGKSWSWTCRHEETGETAAVDVISAASARYGDELQRVIAANRHLAPLGAERLLQANRLILRPGEAWREPPPGPFLFWLAHEALELPEPPAHVVAPILLRCVEALEALIDAAKEQDVSLDLSPELLTLMPDGSIYLREPGLHPPANDDPERQALQFLRGLPLSRETRPMVARASRLEDVSKSLSILLDVRAATPETPAPTGLFARPLGLRALLVGAAGLIAVAAIAVAAVLVLSGGGGVDQASAPTPSPVATAAPAQLAACLQLQLPASLAHAQAACGPLGDVFSHDGSCARGTACSRRNEAGGTPVIGWNARTLAYVGDDGELYAASDGAADPVRLTSRGGVQDPVWSPDGRYLAYLRVQELPSDDGAASRLSTQLHVIEVERPANDGIVLAANSGATQPEWQQFHLLSPRWSADGRRILFLRGSPEAPGGDLFTVDLPFVGETIDFGRLRAAALPTETILSLKMASLRLTPGDFGVEGYFDDLFVAPDDSLFLQICQDIDRCALGRWNGTAALPGGIENGVIYGVPAAADSHGNVYGWVARGSQGWRLFKVALAGGAIEELGVALPAGPHRFALLHDGESVAVETAEGELLRIHLANGSTNRLASGGAPAGFLSRPEVAGYAPAVPTVPFNTPTPAPTPTPTPTATPPPYQPMTLLISARRGGSYLPAATVVALTSGKECARGQTDAGGRLSLTFPAQSAPPECGTPGAEIRLEVDGQAVAGFISYSPGGVTTRDVEVP